jgi:hypothetical protein
MYNWAIYIGDWGLGILIVEKVAVFGLRLL